MKVTELGGVQVEAPHMFVQQLPGQEQMHKLRSAAAVAVVDSHDRVLLMRRVPDLGGDWVFPGGKVDPGETPNQAARRETREESGLWLTGPLLPLARYISPPEISGKSHDVHIVVTNYDETASPPPRVNSPGEMSDWGWFDPQEALESAQAGMMPIATSSRYAIGRVDQYLSDRRENEYSEVLVGGTFRDPDRSEAMLSHAFGAGDVVYIGLTTDPLAERLHAPAADNVVPFGTRLDRLRRFLDGQGVLNNAVIFPLDNRVGPKGLDTKPEAVVVHDNSLGGGEQINTLRTRRGLEPLKILRVAN